MLKQQDPSLKYQFANDLIFKGNKSSSEVQQLLIHQGFNENTAQAAVNKLIHIKRFYAKKRMINGLVWIVGGIGFMTLLFSLALPLPFIFISFSVVICGAIEFLCGFAGSNQ